MKTIIALFSLILVQQAFAAESTLCINEAYKAAYERYTYALPDAMITLQRSGKPVVEEGKIYHSIQVISLESGERTLMGVIVEAKSCKIIAVN